jgi:hypothetical protein
MLRKRENKIIIKNLKVEKNMNRKVKEESINKNSI